jgi:hypothetical protein
MFGRKSNINYLGLSEIAPIIEDFLVSKNPYIASQLEGLDENQRLNVLGGTPQWTYLQTIDTYLTAQVSKKLYSPLLHQQEILGVKIIPPTFSTGMLYMQKFFEFILHTRQYDEGTIKLLLNKSFETHYSDATNELSRLKDFIRIIQEFELKNDNPNYSGTKDEDEGIDEQLDDMEDLMLLYLERKPAIKPYAQKYGY